MSAGVCLGPQFTSRFIGRRSFPCGSAGKESACNARDLGLIPGLGRSPGEGKGYPLQYSGLVNFIGLQTVGHNWATFTFHTVKGFCIVNKAKVYVFLEFFCSFCDPTDVGNLISGFSAFAKSSLNIWNSRFTYCWSVAWRILSITLLACEMSAIVQ